MERVVPGTVVGYVTDQAGRTLADGLVMLDNKARVPTDSTGRFRFDGMAPGQHTIRVLHFGFDQVIQSFTLDAGSGAAFAVRLRRAPVQLTEVCLTIALPAIVVRVRDIPGTTVAIAHIDSVARFSFDELRNVPGVSGMRMASAFHEMEGRYYVTVSAPGYRDWETNVFVRRGACNVETQVVTADLRR